MPIPEHGERKFFMSLRDSGTPARSKSSRELFIRLIDVLSEQGEGINAPFFHSREAACLLHQALEKSVKGRMCLPSAEVLAVSGLSPGKFLGSDFRERWYPNLRRLLAGVVYDSQISQTDSDGQAKVDFEWWDRDVSCYPTNADKGIEVWVRFRYASERSAGIEMIKLAEKLSLRPFYGDEEISLDGVDDSDNVTDGTSSEPAKKATEILKDLGQDQPIQLPAPSPEELQQESVLKRIRELVENAAVVPSTCQPDAADEYAFVTYLVELDDAIESKSRELLRPVREYVEKLFESIESHLAELARASEAAEDPEQTTQRPTP